MYEHLASFRGGPPNHYHYRLYSLWAKHNWGMVVTGNVQVCASHLTLGRDMVMPSIITEDTVKPFRALAAAMHNKYTSLDDVDLRRPDSRALAIMQLSHAGRQSPNIIGGRFPFARPLGPSATAIGYGSVNTNLLSKIIHRLLFRTPRAMSLADIDNVVEAFVRGAEVAVQAGFDGVQLHAAHGCE
jgi:2,4-dienoyl-CoA reductase-like NADH-dependent reductase (Old Yellow Enzyme family)